MLLSELFDGVDEECEVAGLACDSSEVRSGYVFFCLVGGESDGHTYAADALSRGSVAIVVERKLALDCIQIEVEDSRSALSHAAARFYGYPAKRLKLIGVTGTNGKTTTTYIVKSIIEAAGKTCGLIGTNSIEYAGKTLPSKLTTPDPIELHRIFSDMVAAGVEYAVMEVSAHAAALRKVDGVLFEVMAFTNF